MSLLLVHGVPETPAIWLPLLNELERDDVVNLRLPGFGGPIPPGFDASKDEYVSWLVTEIEKASERGPVDLLGHDWGGAFVLRAAALCPELVRSWISDTAAAADPNFEWHDSAKSWQRPGEGEGFFERQMKLPASVRSRLYKKVGAPDDVALDVASALDATMASCILTLYRSANDLHGNWGAGFERQLSPGLAVIPEDDEYISPSSSALGADRVGAEVARIASGHWWMFDDPSSKAKLFTEFWDSLP